MKYRAIFTPTEGTYFDVEEAPLSEDILPNTAVDPYGEGTLYDTKREALEAAIRWYDHFGRGKAWEFDRIEEVEPEPEYVVRFHDKPEYVGYLDETKRVGNVLSPPDRATRYSSKEAAKRAVQSFLLDAVAHWAGDVNQVAYLYGDWRVDEVDGTA